MSNRSVRFGAARAMRFIAGLATVLTVTVGAASLPAQGPGRMGMGPERGTHRLFVGRGHGPRRFMHLMAMDPAARLLDHQSALQLNGSQVTQLIAIHERTRREQRALRDKIQALVARKDGGRPKLSAAQRDSLASLADAFRELRWRATSAADSVLTPDQRQQVARFEMMQMSRMRGMGMPGQGGMRGMRHPMRGGRPGGAAPDTSGSDNDRL